ncbi:MAG: ribonuclease P protein component [Endomicrobiia bacterium]
MTNNYELKFTFKKYERISKQKEIETVLKNGEKIFSRGVIFYLYKNQANKFSRLAVLVSSKVEKLAVVRNKFKRRIREIFRLNKHKILYPVDIIVIATKDSIRLKYKVLEEIFLNILKEKNLIKNEFLY